MAVSTLNDRTINKIAFCSAVVAGFAYVGYSFVKSAFSRQKRRGHQSEGNEDQQHRVLLRRLSQTTQTDILLGELDLSEVSKVTLRPKSVQERIRELNVRARQFADAVVAIETNGTRPQHGVCSRSLQATPWGSPRVLSPVELRHFVPSASPDMTDKAAGSRDRSPNASPVHHKWNRRSLRGHRKVEFIAEEDSRTKVPESIWTENRTNLLGSLESLLGPGRNLDLEEAQRLVALLYSEDDTLLLKTLTTVSNCAAFTTSQNALRSAGLLSLIHKFLFHQCYDIQQQTCHVISNMALNELNMQEMRLVVLSLVRLGLSITPQDGHLLLAVVTALTNIAVLPTWHRELGSFLNRLYQLLDEESWSNSDGLGLQSLKVLINLSCNDDMVPSLLAAESPKRLIYLLDFAAPSQIILRVTTYLANLASATVRLNVDPIHDLPAEYKAAAPDTMYAAIFGVNMVERIKRKAKFLSESHSDEDVRFQAQRLIDSLE